MAKEKTADPVERAKSLKTSILNQIEGIDLSVSDYAQKKSNISQIFKINAGLRAAQFSGERDLGITVSSSKNIKEVIEVLNKASGVMEYLLNQTAYLTKRGETDAAIEMIQEQAKLQEKLNDAVKTLDETVNGYLAKGYGRKATINEYKEAIYAKKIEEAIKLYKSGKKLSEIVKTSELPVEVLTDKCGPFKNEFLDANKKEIEKLFFKEQNLKQLSESYEVKIKHIRATLILWAKTDQKLAELLEAYFETEKASSANEEATAPSEESGADKVLETV
ncbi:hypothetical protein [Sulfurospirillum multivorans]|uniref:Uncharacterized protein n=2 Tax=Sulfurospirillum multivorans TaxID=66821 RepID=A0AA86ALW7_SULMK|nr:hypothetical protein [Sulfurospirillum multivorans]AHJ13131.1 hypothetical protein SMUL_1876 [Sulfurospirillum multivorans DSM 12446]QEH06619.1 hypothetical protein SMN_1854 [Sulfurospirillum multivorans]